MFSGPGARAQPQAVSASPNRRKEMDVTKLLMSDFEVATIRDSTMNVHVKFYGPKDGPYAGGVWTVRVDLPPSYPYKSPSIGFVNKIFHPNVDESSGAVCLDVINQTWSPMFDLLNVFTTFLPQLLTYPNPTDPLNAMAAALLLRDPAAYEAKVKEHVRAYATPEIVAPYFAAAAPGHASKEEESEMSDDEDDEESEEVSSHGSLDLNDI